MRNFLKLTTKAFGFVLVMMLFAALTTVESKAQASSGQITVSPTVINAVPGDDFFITITNTSSFNYDFELHGILLTPNPADRSFDISRIIGNIEDFIQLPEDYPDTIEPFDTIRINMKYIRAEDPYIMGVLIKEQGDNSENVGVGMGIVSVLLDTLLTEEDIDNIKASIDVSSNVSLGGLSLGNEYEMRTEFENLTSKIIQATGEVSVVDQDFYLASIPHTQDLLDPIYPQEGRVLAASFNDERDLFSRVGSLTFSQQLRFNNNLILLEKSVFVLPLEMITVVFGAVLLMIFLLFLTARRKKAYELQGGNTLIVPPKQQPAQPNVQQKAQSQPAPPQQIAPQAQAQVPQQKVQPPPQQPVQVK